VHSDRLGGPVWIFLMIVMFLTVALALFVVIDGIRRLVRCGPDERPWLLLYVCLEALYLVMLGVAQLSIMPRVFAAVIVVATPFASARDDVPGPVTHRIRYSPYPEENFPNRVYFGVKRPADVPASIQERACTSPTWYSPT